jgi:hypothetical protein
MAIPAGRVEDVVSDPLSPETSRVIALFTAGNCKGVRLGRDEQRHSHEATNSYVILLFSNPVRVTSSLYLNDGHPVSTKKNLVQISEITLYSTTAIERVGVSNEWFGRGSSWWCIRSLLKASERLGESAGPAECGTVRGIKEQLNSDSCSSRTILISRCQEASSSRSTNIPPSAGPL